jgi:hypothetical protein
MALDADQALNLSQKLSKANPCTGIIGIKDRDSSGACPAVKIAPVTKCGPLKFTLAVRSESANSRSIQRLVAKNQVGYPVNELLLRSEACS